MGSVLIRVGDARSPELETIRNRVAVSFQSLNLGHPRLGHRQDSDFSRRHCHFLLLFLKESRV